MYSSDKILYVYKLCQRFVVLQINIENLCTESNFFAIYTMVSTNLDLKHLMRRI